VAIDSIKEDCSDLEIVMKLHSFLKTEVIGDILFTVSFSAQRLRYCRRDIKSSYFNNIKTSVKRLNV